MPVSLPKKKKYFTIKKYVKYDQIMEELCSEDENQNLMANNNQGEVVPKNKLKRNNTSRLKFINYKGASGKPLSEDEKLSKLKILSKIVRRYRRKLKNIKKKFSTNVEKNFKKYLGSKLSGKKKDRNDVNVSVTSIISGLKRLKANRNADFSNDRNVIEDMVRLIAEGKLTPESIAFKKIASQVRLFLSKDKIKHISKTQPKIFINLPEKDVYITKKELSFYQNAGEDQDIYRTIYGIKPVVNMNELQYNNMSNGRLANLFNDFPVHQNANRRQSQDELMPGNMSNDHFFQNLFRMDSYNNNLFIK
jgi:hypothetical protein